MCLHSFSSSTLAQICSYWHILFGSWCSSVDNNVYSFETIDRACTSCKEAHLSVKNGSRNLFCSTSSTNSPILEDGDTALDLAPASSRIRRFHQPYLLDTPARNNFRTEITPPLTRTISRSILVRNISALSTSNRPTTVLIHEPPGSTKSTTIPAKSSPHASGRSFSGHTIPF